MSNKEVVDQLLTLLSNPIRIKVSILLRLLECPQAQKGLFLKSLIPSPLNEIYMAFIYKDMLFYEYNI